jgi:hypothetical protein
VVSCDFWIGNKKCGLKVEYYIRGMRGKFDQLQARDRNGEVRVIYLCADHAAQLLRQATGEVPVPSP